MSLSNPRAVNPAEKKIEWSGSKGKFFYYDKEKMENVFFNGSIYVVALDELSTIKGFHKNSESSIYSNEVRSIAKEKLVVKSFKGGLIASGLYAEIKGDLDGGKFGKSLYAAMISKDGKNLELVNFQLYGSALGSYIDAKINVDNGNVLIFSPSTTELKNGNTIYFAPQIVKKEVRTDILDRCKDMDRDLQDHLTSYFNKSGDEKEQISDSNSIETNHRAATDIQDTPEDDLPF